jgi:predicted TIM-barrel fold metal-dependent hydrolase
MPDDNPEDIDVKIIAIEEHWNSVGIRDALDRLQGGARDESIAFNTMGDNQARLEDIGQGRIEAMDAAGIDVSILSVVTPATQALPAREAVALARDANDEAAGAVRAHPARFRAFATLPTNIHITSSGMLQERLLRHALDFTGAGQVLFSTDYPSTNPAQRRSDSSSTPSPTRRTALRSPPATRKLCST